MGTWEAEMRSAVVMRVKSKHAEAMARLARVARAADAVLTDMSRVDRGVYRIEPGAILALRQSLEHCGIVFNEGNQ